jgi:Fe-S-cluster-containing dehydrogenase component
MISFDEERQKATKCFLCDGRPKCVEACPSAALRFVPWRDITREGRGGGAVLSVTPVATAKACIDCHVPSGKKPARR